MMKVFIPMFNRLTWPKKMAEDLTRLGCEVIFIDNNSTYKPLLDWYKTCPYKVHMLTKNYGERVFWSARICEEYDDRYYIVSDPDLDVSELPSDFIKVLKEGLDGNVNIIKCGLSLKLDDLPDNEYSNHAKRFESVYWLQKDLLGNYSCGIDTTFAMYDKERLVEGWDEGVKFYIGTRTPPPYSARHLPWYLTEEFVENNEEQKFYHNICDNQWALTFKRVYKKNK